MIHQREDGVEIVKVYDEELTLKGWKEQDGTIYFEDVSFQQIEYCRKNLPGDYKIQAMIIDIQEPYLKEQMITCLDYFLSSKESEIKGYFHLQFYVSKWSKNILREEIVKQINCVEGLNIEEIYEEVDDFVFLFQKKWETKDISLKEMCELLQQDVSTLLSIVENTLDSFKWKDEYEKDEFLFCREVVTPLLLKMSFQSVKYHHGTQEYGKDYLVSTIDQFGFTNYHGIQVKAGNIDGKIHSRVDEIIGQLEDAFSIPIMDLNVGDGQYISNFYLMTSGNYTNNAKQKIKHKIHSQYQGSVFFLEKEDIQRLIEKYW